MVLCERSAIHDFLNHAPVLGGTAGIIRHLSVFLTYRGDRLRRLGHDNLNPPVLAPAFFRVVGGDGSGVRVPDRPDSIGAQSAFDQRLAGMFGPEPRKLSVILKGPACVVLDRYAVGMSSHFDTLGLEFAEGDADAFD